MLMKMLFVIMSRFQSLVFSLTLFVTLLEFTFGENIQVRQDNDPDSPAILGGSDASSRINFPWMARISCYPSDLLTSDAPACGGSLISVKHVLTAAHCLYLPTDYDTRRRRSSRKLNFKTSVKASYCRVTLGDLRGSGDVEGTEIERVVRGDDIYPHESYDPSSTLRRNDIGMLKIDTVTISTTVNVIQLAVAAPVSGTRVNLAGWGLKSDGWAPGPLQTAEAEVRSTETCSAAWNCGGQPPRFESSLNVCYGGNGKVVACKGDGGAPVYIGNGSAASLVAINSFSRSQVFKGCFFVSKLQYWYRLLGWLFGGRLFATREAIDGGDEWLPLSARGTFGEYICDPRIPTVGTLIPAYSAWITQTQAKLV